MSKTVRIPLDTPIRGHKGDFTEVVVREPTYDEYVSCGGEPFSIGQSAEGAFFEIEKPEVVFAYAEACIVEPDVILLGNAGWRVAREVRKAILGFFRAPAEASATSETSPTTSSSSSTSPSTPSAA